MNGRAKRAEVYPDELRYKILTGLIKQMKRDGRIQEGCIGSVMRGEEYENQEMMKQVVSSKIIHIIYLKRIIKIRTQDPTVPTV